MRVRTTLSDKDDHIDPRFTIFTRPVRIRTLLLYIFALYINWLYMYRIYIYNATLIHTCTLQAN